MTNTPFNIVVCGVGGQGTVLSKTLLAECALAGGAFVRSAETIGMAQRGGIVLGHVRIVMPKEGSDKTGDGSDKTGDGSDKTGDGSLSYPSDQLDCLSPLVPLGTAQLLIGFEPVETLRAYRYCSPGALVVTATDPLMPPTAAVKKLKYNGKAQMAALEHEAAEGRIGRLEFVDNSSVMDKLGFDKALNVVLLGAALGILADSGSPYASLLSFDAMQEVIKTTVKERFVDLNLKALELGYQLQCT